MKNNNFTNKFEIISTLIKFPKFSLSEARENSSILAKGE